MRKSFFLLAGSVVALIALVLLAWLPGRAVSTSPTPGVGAADGAKASAVELAAPGGRERERASVSEPATTTAHVPDAIVPVAGDGASTKTSFSGVLRVRIVRTDGGSELPPSVDVRAASRIGVVYDALREGDSTDFVVRDLKPGSYVVLAQALGLRTAWCRVEVAPGPGETLASVPMTPSRVVHVRWRTTSGDPIAGAFAGTTVPFDVTLDPQSRSRRAVLDSVDGWGSPNSAFAGTVVTRMKLAVTATREVPPESGPVPEASSMASRTRLVLATTTPDGRRESTEQRTFESVWRSPAAAGRATAPDTFGFLQIDEPGPVVITAWCDDVRIDTAVVDGLGDEVEFVTSSDVLYLLAPRTPTLLEVVDAATGSPVREARVLVPDRGWSRTDERGRAAIFVRGASAEAEVEAFGYRTGTVTLPGISKATDAPVVVRLTAQDAPAAPDALVHVSFQIESPPGWRPSPEDFELVDLATFDETVPFLDNDARRKSSRVGPTSRGAARELSADPYVITFAREARGRFALVCRHAMIDVETVRVKPEDFSPDERRVTGVLHVGVPSFVGVRLREPPPPGTLVVIETADGLPVRTLEVNDLGVVQTRLGARPHRLHVIERGRKSPSMPFTVDSDPYFLDVDP